MNYFEKELIENNVHELFKRVCSLESNQKLNIKKMLMSSSAFHKLHLYSEKDLGDAADLIQKCLFWIPKDRISAEDALNHPFCQD